MSTPYVEAAVAALWLVIAGVFGALVPVSTPSGWVVLAALATTPPLFFIHYWKRPVLAMPVSSQRALR